MTTRRVGLFCTIVLVLTLTVAVVPEVGAQRTMPIGQIQGRAGQSDYQGQYVQIRGIVTGVLEDENARGTRFYTIFLQDLPGTDDGDPLTSDGIAIFAGARKPNIAPGDIVLASGTVTEFYGLTELDNNGLQLMLESRNNPLPAAIELDPPTDNEEAAAVLEQYEAMRVSIPEARVVGPAHVGCGFSVVRSDSGPDRIIVRDSDDPVGQIVGVLHPSDVDCREMPDVAYGDEIQGLTGPLSFHFDRFKIVYQDASELQIKRIEREEPKEPGARTPEGVLIATFNVEDFFDTQDDTGDSSEPKLTATELTLKQSKLAATIGRSLACPALVGVQEVENGALLQQLVLRLVEYCGFSYIVSHIDSPDARGVESALLSNPEKVAVTGVQLRQGCTELDTGITDLAATCPPGQQPLFSRPPLQVEATIGGHPFVIMVNHFKSKRDGAEETAPRRLAQAKHLRQLLANIKDADPDKYLVVLGDFNDYEGTELMDALSAGGLLADALTGIPSESRYSYIFDGASQLLDWILISPALEEYLAGAGILHANADLPYQMAGYGDGASLSLRSSDHDVPYIVIDFSSPLGSPAGVPNPAQDRRLPTSTAGPSSQAVVPEPTAIDSDEPDSELRAAGDDDQMAASATKAIEVGPQPEEATSAGDGQGDLSWALILATGVVVAAGLGLVVRASRHR